VDSLERDSNRFFDVPKGDMVRVELSHQSRADPAHKLGACRCVALLSADIRAVPAGG